MEVRVDILNNLKCAECAGYLSCGPVLINSSGTSVCGRCAIPNREGTRNLPYEELAQLVAFPCQYQGHGCPARFSFLLLKDHEEQCEFRPLQCPISSSKTCNWIGFRDTLLLHCKSAHPDNVLEHPCTVKRDFSKNEETNYIVTTLGFLFLIHIKICQTTANIFHRISHIGELNSSMFHYDFEISKDGRKVVHSGKATVESAKISEDDDSMKISIVSLVDILQQFKELTIKITLLTQQRCGKCEDYVTRYSYNQNGVWYCDECLPATRKCDNSKKGCVYEDVDSKVIKHEYYYCRYGTYCYICTYSITGSLEEHYSKEHSDVTHPMNITQSIKKLTKNPQYHIAVSEVGILLVSYKIKSSIFEIGVHSSIEGCKISNYKCMAILTNPNTGQIITKQLNLSYDIADWSLSLEEAYYKPLIDNDEVLVQIDFVSNF